MQGIAFVIDQLGQTIMQRDQLVAKLTAENEQLKAKVADLQPETVEGQE